MKKLMAANWKMFKTRSEATAFFDVFLPHIANMPADREVAIFAPFTCLADCGVKLAGASAVGLGAQNMYAAQEGAFTGEISPRMLKDCQCNYVLTGHSERRSIFGESDELVGKKTAFALTEGFNVVFCLGETLEERENGKLKEVLERQMRIGLGGLDKSFAPERLSLAYEPVWAIGTGKVAGPAEILEAHALVRACVKEIFAEKALEMRILYGGSVKPDNATQIIGLDNVDGVLVGGASLDAESFAKIVLA